MLNVPERIGVMPERLWQEYQKYAGAMVPYEGGISDLREISPEEIRLCGPLSDGRKNILAALCWFLGIRGVSEEEYWTTIQEINNECFAPPLDWAIVERKAQYTWQRAKAARDKMAVEAAAYQKLAQKILSN